MVQSPLAEKTLHHYETHAESFWAGTKDHDVSQNHAALLRSIPYAGPYDLLDLGCGPGRDLKAFREAGHRPVGLDGCAKFVDMARAFSGCEVLLQNFFDLDLGRERFDGVFANATLFHVPKDLLDEVLVRIGVSLRSGGILFTSNPRGNDEEDLRGDRFGVLWQWETWRDRVARAGFEYVEHYYRPSGVPFEEQRWLASVWRRPSSG